MPKKRNAETEQAAEFDLKHRITGAAVLLFLGALVLPWLLGPPSEASKIELGRTQPQDSIVEPAEIIIASDDSKISSEISDVEETVYISKITPLDAQGNKGLVDAANQAAAGTQGDGAQTASQESSEQDSSAALQELVREQSTVKQGEQNSDRNAQALKPTAKNSEAEERKKQQQEQAEREKALQAALAAEIESSKPKTTSTASANRVSVGWVVQVGLFTEKNRAIALISELKSKGFDASSSVVDTNRGKNTGTRVWLGPFAKRVSAINEQKRLKSKAGKEGFIRVYP